MNASAACERHLSILKVSPEELAQVKAILGIHVPNRTVWAFGSRVTGTARRFSDLDLAIIGEEPLASTVLGDLKDAFSESDLPWRVDVVDWGTTSEGFREIISEAFVVVLP